MRLEGSLALIYGQQNTLAWTWLGSPGSPVCEEKCICSVSNSESAA